MCTRRCCTTALLLLLLTRAHRFLLRICGAAGDVVEPHVPLLVPALLQALAAHESAALSYLSFHVDK